MALKGACKSHFLVRFIALPIEFDGTQGPMYQIRVYHEIIVTASTRPLAPSCASKSRSSNIPGANSLKGMHHTGPYRLLRDARACLSVWRGPRKRIRVNHEIAVAASSRPLGP
jgi:hypothetical protein